MSLTFMSHFDRLVRRVVVDEDGAGVECCGLQDLLFEGAVSSLQQCYPLDTTGGNQKASVGVTALPVHH